jgi:hypothetical protein
LKKVVCTPGIEAFNLLIFSPSTLPPFYPSLFNPLAAGGTTMKIGIGS